MSVCSTLMLAALAEPYTTAVLVAIFGALTAFSVLFSNAMDRLGVPMVLLFLVLGMLGGSEGIGGIEFNNYEFASRVGTMALALILFDGGLNTPVGSIKQVIVPAGLLATAGVAMTAGLVALFARSIGIQWSAALLLGAVVSSTDAAAVFSVLRGGRLSLQKRVGNTVEVESCVNDPMAVILTVSLIDVLTSHQRLVWRLAIGVPLQLLIGTAVGVTIGLLGRWLLRRVRLTTVGLYPALTLAIAFVSYGMATVANGSGFLSVYITAVALGAYQPLPYRAGLVRIHDALAWLSQIAMFLMLGLLVFPSRLIHVAGTGIALALFLAFIARPLAVLPCLLPFGYRAKEIAYIGWVGLRGAVPIILATFPVLAGVSEGDWIFNIVFFIVVVSSIVPGMTIRRTTKWLKLDTPEKPLPPAVLEINAAYSLNGQLVSFFIEPSVAVCGASLREIEFPSGSAVILVVRGHELLAARGSTVLQPNDHVYVFFRPEDRPFIELLFGTPEEGGAVGG